jgi:hypothetical protein
MDSPIDEVKNGFTTSMELVFFVVYIVEMVLKMIAQGIIFGRGTYLRDAWNILDFCIVVASIASMVRSSASSTVNDSINFSSLRTLRILKPLRTINSVVRLRTLVQAILNSLPFLFDILIIILFSMGMFAIVGLQLFKGVLLNRCFEASTGKPLGYDFNEDQLCGGSKSCPTGYLCGKMFDNPVSGIYSFDNILESYLLVFVTVTMEGWSVANNYVIYAYSWYSVLFFTAIVLIEGFFLFKLALAIISAKFSEAQSLQQDTSEIGYINSASSVIVTQMTRSTRDSFQR